MPPEQNPAIAASSTAIVPPLAAPHKATYTLCYQEDCRGLEKRVRFEAASAAVALEIAQGEADGRWALLLCDGEILCRLERAAAGPGQYWVIDAVPPNFTGTLPSFPQN